MSLLNAGLINNNSVGDDCLHISAPLWGGLPQDINKTIHECLEKKISVLHLKLDRATRHGQDAETLEADDIRQGGLSLSTLADLHKAFTGISPVNCVLQINAGAENVAMLAMFDALLQANGLKACDLKGTIGANPLPVLFEDGTLPLELDAIYGSLAAGIRWAEKSAPELKTILADSSFYARLGFDKAAELGLVLAEAITYVKALQDRGLEKDAVIRHLEIVLSGGSEEENLDRLAVIKDLWQELQRANVKLPALAILEGEDSLHAAGALRTSETVEELKQAAKHIYDDIMSQGGLDMAMQNGSLQKAVVRARNERMSELAVCYDKGELVWPVLEELRIDTAYVKEKRLGDIAEYQKDIDDLEKRRFLARTVRMNCLENEGLISIAKEAFFVGATLADVVIALHTERNDCYLDKTVDCQDVLQRFVKLRAEMESIADEYGRMPSFVVCTLGMNEEEAAEEAEQWQKIFAPSGLTAEIYTENKDIESVAEDMIKMGAAAVLLLVPQGRLAQSGRLTREIRYLNSDVRIFVAEQGAVANDYVYPISWVSYLTTDMATCLELIKQDIY